MQSEEFDNRIREAADHHHPTYDEGAWMKMEKLLDKHLPQKEDERRRFIFFLLLFLLIGGGISALLLTGKKAGKELPAPIAKQETVQKSPLAEPGNNPLPSKEERVPSSGNTVIDQTRGNKTVTGKEEVTGGVAGNNFAVPFNDTKKENNHLLKPAGRREQRINDILTRSGDKNITTDQQPVNAGEKPVPVAAAKEQEKTAGQPVFETAKAGNPGTNVVPPVNNVMDQPSAKDKNETSLVTKPVAAIDKPGEKEDKDTKKETAQKPVNLKNNKRSSFSINFSAGPDISVVGSGKTGKMTLLSGVGLGYNYKGRVTLRTGFYESNKVYTAAPADYHASATFYYYYPNLQKIDANCKVYEIPVSLSYNFGHNPKQSWFASSGVSSYLMKRETYNYFYKRSPGEPTVNRERTMRGVNKHYFAVLTLSGGYQRNINKAMTFTVEPYYKLPLKGVGYGKVKLNSSGVLFTVGIKPFDLFKKQGK